MAAPQFRRIYPRPSKSCIGNARLLLSASISDQRAVLHYNDPILHDVRHYPEIMRYINTRATFRLSFEHKMYDF
ncbi:hypothetical protein [secondary endosymbiont of Ctenarytaina eucalypti]|uniref:Uncharacterized protein n=1 Tax=secondary endosymbiont of Ctenarytaina eucalypti TaxID=1199245 RepID=J3YRC6_9ENTR|nr:hypothetical protein [secondary endosymbiont of Ctenarytaina eucalypti]AFP84593.1 hypothetical protein A359_01920 [secondary endosymbiont of Ctenarytaina eucalypti]